VKELLGKLAPVSQKAGYFLGDAHAEIFDNHIIFCCIRILLISLVE